LGGVTCTGNDKVPLVVSKLWVHMVSRRQRNLDGRWKFGHSRKCLERGLDPANEHSRRA
jgi:hypothetical protein